MKTKLQENEMDKMNVKALTIALGSTWGLMVLLAGWAAMLGIAVRFVEIMGSVYIGYEATLLGSLIGAAWAFLDGAIGGLVIALIYNAIAKKN